MFTMINDLFKYFTGSSEQERGNDDPQDDLETGCEWGEWIQTPEVRELHQQEMKRIYEAYPQLMGKPNNYEGKKSEYVDYIMHSHRIKGDNDVWVERYYKNSEGRPIYYYRSIRTNRCCLMEPPTGAQTIVYLHELDRVPYLKKFALGPLDRDIKDIEQPNYGKKRCSLFGPQRR